MPAPRIFLQFPQMNISHKRFVGIPKRNGEFLKEMDLMTLCLLMTMLWSFAGPSLRYALMVREVEDPEILRMKVCGKTVLMKT